MVRIKIKNSVKKSLYALLTTSWLSGIVFFILNNWVRIEGDFGQQKHPLQFKILVIHAISAFLILMIIGSILTNHIPMAWKTKRLRKIGVILTTVIVVQIVTAFLLYYMGDVGRDYVVYIHLSIGLILPIIIYTHIFLGKSRTSAVKTKFSVKNN